MKKTLNLFFLFLIISSTAFSKDFVIVSLPKAGTHLCSYLFEMLTEKKPLFLYWKCNGKILSYEEYEKVILNSSLTNEFVYHHPDLPYDRFSWEFSKFHHEYIHFLMIRDLRDVLLSWIFFAENYLNVEMNKIATIEERLTYMLDCEGKTPLEFIDMIRRGVELYRNDRDEYYNKDFILIKFEDLVGIRGNGNPMMQRIKIRQIANILNIPLTDQKLNHICDNLFGDIKKSPTFFKGQIGEWRKHFTEEHILKFNKHYGHLQFALGYTLD